MVENASLFFAYDELQDAIRHWNNMPPSTKLSLDQLMIAAAGAGGVVSFFL